MKRTRSYRRTRRVRRRTTRTRRRPKRTLASKVRKIVRASIPNEVRGAIITAGSFNKNVWNSIDMTNVPPKTANADQDWNTRLQQNIYIKYAAVCMHVNNLPTVTPAGSAPVTWVRMMILRSNKRGTGLSNAGNGAFMWMGVDGNRVDYLSISNTMESMTYKIDPEFYTTLYDKVTVLGLAGNGINGRVRKCYAKVNKKLSMSGKNTGVGTRNYDLWFVYFAWSPTDVNPFQPVGNGGIDWKIKYQELGEPA